LFHVTSKERKLERISSLSKEILVKGAKKRKERKRKSR
jgi:hypothetical protein